MLSLQNDLGVPLTQNGDRYGIVDTYVLPPVFFTLCEVMALALAARLVYRQTDESNPHVESALLKLANMLPLNLGEHLKLSAAALRRKPFDPEYIRVFEQVAIAWCTRRQLKIQYQALQREDIREWLLAPYFVDMTSTGFSTYVIGQASSRGGSGIVTFKLNRIKEAEILETTYIIPEGMNLDRMLESSWGIMRGEEVEVKLRFSPEVTRRVKESVWHPSQKIDDTGWRMLNDVECGEHPGNDSLDSRLGTGR